MLCRPYLTCAKLIRFLPLFPNYLKKQFSHRSLKRFDKLPKSSHLEYSHHAPTLFPDHPSTTYLLPALKEFQPMDFSVENSFSYYTLSHRLPLIAKKVIKDIEDQRLDFSRAPGGNRGTLQRLNDLITDLPNRKVAFSATKLKHLDLNQHEHQILNNKFLAWENFLKPFTSKRMRDIKPGILGELFFYWELLDACDYFQLKTDPCLPQKLAHLQSSTSLASELADLLNRPKGVDQDLFLHLLHCSLWGNTGDLTLDTLPTADDLYKEFYSSPVALKTNILADDSELIWEHLSRQKTSNKKNVDIILDNAGSEYLCDLALADFLLTREYASTITLHVKEDPIFLSDVTINDAHSTFEWLLEGESEMRTWGLRLLRYQSEGRLNFTESSFWSVPQVFWEMPVSFAQNFARCGLVFTKGDANYRRLIGDLKWSFETPFSHVVKYFPCPVVAVRTNKAELIVGLDEKTAREVPKKDANWLTSGKWGVIQYSNNTNQYMES